MTQANHFLFWNSATLPNGTYYTEPIHLGRIPNQPIFLAVQANLVRAAGGATCRVYIQTSFDEGATWCDIMCLHMVNASERLVGAVCATITLGGATITPSDGALADDTLIQGVLGDFIRMRMTVAGGYTATLRVDGVVR
jgi:hypothetical protein